MLNDLILERLKYQAAKNNNMLMSDEEADKLMQRLASKNKHPKTGKPLTIKQFKQALRAQGVNFKKLRERMRISNSWQRYVYRKFSRQVSVNNSQINKAMKQARSPSASKAAKTKMTKDSPKILKVSFLFSDKKSEVAKSKRVAEAVSFRNGLSSCSKIAQKAALSSNVKIKYINNGMKYAKIRKAVNGRKSGELSSPVLFNDFVALYATCGGRVKKTKTVSVNSGQRKKVESMLKRKAIMKLAKKHLRQLKQDANIEYR